MWPDASSNDRLSLYWYVLFHCLFWADLYLDGTDKDFLPPPPFTLDELDETGIVPSQSFSVDVILGYCDHVTQKGERILLKVRSDDLVGMCDFSWGSQMTYTELVIDIIRHVQEHSA